MTILDAKFFNQPADVLAEKLLSKQICSFGVTVQICETEAYLPNDSANHCFRGKTKRNAPMFGPAGHAYVYLCYGIHHLFNIVCGPVGSPQAVLIRGAIPVDGMELIKKRRGNLDLIGPGKLGQALGVGVKHSGIALVREKGLFVQDGTIPNSIKKTPRIGIDYAKPKDKKAHLRYLAQF